MTSYVIEADGGSRGNPGPAGYGAVVKDASDGQVLAEAAEAIGVTTNNVAEYRGLIAGLRAVLDVGGDGAQVAVRMDSKLVVEQMAGRWKIKNEGLRPLAAEAGSLVRRLRVTEWTWIPRERNSHADRLANEAMDAAAKGLTWKAGGTTTPAAPDASEGQASGSKPSGTKASGTKASGTKASGTATSVQQTDLLDAGDMSELSAPTASVASAQARVTGQGKGTGWAPPTRVATSLLLLRHGETELSLERRFSGRGEAELTANGLAQASAAAARLARDPYRLDVIVTSPLKRARQTAEAVAEQAGVEVEVFDDLREADFGAWEGHTFTEVQRRWPAELTAWLSDPDVAPPGGESFAETGRRVQAAREHLVERYAGKTVLAVSHVTPIKLLLRDALLAPLQSLYRMHLDLACLSLIEYYADGPAVVKSFNDTSHLR
ncbi:FIG006762: Phosphoglycerate mutase family [[Actinomadura] parvosata subsp. kistnae]|uniref:Bifunctional RNase H/acid phosphatase n=1 Tax=[Actinomadura] parvosata subsp. kistnae TaxID=1909395 RepID=A0A1U9ZQE9_9ACTN|nr:bifunctional RNase H/acid phosphatase [Nonomuraea sp. ATCC 55076]AQZ60181.1 bifunctional RNase H/acid phosphatase [Nonomuraea sp. ATCC 55076]SPL91349.1 FIG006762: Phosphoglycerate mutase family [Actinomadura parvosata subsp. kistnae]